MGSDWWAGSQRAVSVLCGGFLAARAADTWEEQPGRGGSACHRWCESGLRPPFGVWVSAMGHPLCVLDPLALHFVRAAQASKCLGRHSELFISASENQTPCWLSIPKIIKSFPSAALCALLLRRLPQHFK